MSIVCNEKMTVDPETGIKKRTVVTERVVTTKTFHAMAVDDRNDDKIGSAGQSPTTGHSSVTSRTSTATGTALSPATTKDSIAFRPRTVELAANPFGDISFDKIGEALIVTRIKPNSYLAKNIHVGDSIIEINGRSAIELEDFDTLNNTVTLKVIATPLHKGPSVYYRTIADYNGDDDAQMPDNLRGLTIRKGEVLQAFCRDKNWIQGRKVNDISRVGACPINVVGDQVAMLTPYGRRVLILLGVPGVGRRTLKSMLLAMLPQYFTTAIPYTSRKPKSTELEGREYYFRTKNELKDRIRVEVVRSCIRGGRVCVLDCSPQALRHLYNSEFMPFVVLIAPPDFDEQQRINRLRAKPFTDQQLKGFGQESHEMLTGEFARKIHLVLVNRNMDTTFERLLDALNQMRYEIQWIPEEWLRR